jgi:Zn-dependent alcohol dehydrogenase
VGGIGLSVIMGAQRRGCTPIIAVDISDTKLKFARRMGATHLINASKKSVLEAIRLISPDGLDYAGDASVIRQPWKMLLPVLNTAVFVPSRGI